MVLKFLLIFLINKEQTFRKTVYTLVSDADYNHIHSFLYDDASKIALHSTNIFIYSDDKKT